MRKTRTFWAWSRRALICAATLALLLIAAGGPLLHAHEQGSDTKCSLCLLFHAPGAPAAHTTLNTFLVSQRSVHAERPAQTLDACVTSSASRAPPAGAVQL